MKKWYKEKSGYVRAQLMTTATKREGLLWDEISDRFPERGKGMLQVHYSTKLKRRSEISKTIMKRWSNW